MGGKQKDYSDAVDLYERGLSIADVAAKFDVTRQSMHQVLRRRGVKMRPHTREGAQNHFFRGTSASDRSQNLAEKAVQKGILVRPAACETCGTQAAQMRDGRSTIQAHHDDYNAPLVVRWLCQPCHHAWHKSNRAIPERRR